MTTKTFPYTIGCDPELFLIDQDGKFRSAHNLIPGSKHNPTEVLSGAIQPDGTAAEFNIHPATTAEEFCENIKNVLTELQDRISAKNKDLRLVVTPTALFDKEYFRKLPGKAKLFGCEPDMNAYTGEFSGPPPTKEPFRTAGGHIHVGWDQGLSVNDGAHIYDCQQAVKQLDSVLYPLSLLWDDDDKRRTLYGKIGSYRPKHYGVEYRPLSNMWVSDPDLQVWVFEATKHSMEMLDEDIVVFHDYFQQSIIGQLKKDVKPSRLALLEYHDYLVEEYQVPKLPEAYIRVHH